MSRHRHRLGQKFVILVKLMTLLFRRKNFSPRTLARNFSGSNTACGSNNTGKNCPLPDTSPERSLNGFSELLLNQKDVSDRVGLQGALLAPAVLNQQRYTYGTIFWPQSKRNPKLDQVSKRGFPADEATSTDPPV